MSPVVKDRYLKIGILAVLLSCANSSPLYVSPGARHAFPEASQRSRQDGVIKSRFAGGKIIVDVYPLRGEGYIDLALRISNQPKSWRKLKKWNRNLRFPHRDRPIPVPFDFLNARYRLQAVKQLFPRDRLTSRGWEHRVTYRGETMWFIAETFTGDGANYTAIQRANRMRKGQPITIGKVILIPHNLLSDDFSQDLPRLPDLTYERDKNGKLYAVYKLKRGEALYSAVVVRFTGRVDAGDVNDMVNKLLKINGIKDPKKIPAGRKIRIPFEYLSDDFLTEGAPTRLVKLKARRRSKRLYVIIDPGHGGADPGVVKGRLHEDELAYDIMLRLKKYLQDRGVTVYSTVLDASDNGQPKNTRYLANGSNEFVLTTPRYRIADPRVSVNMRVYLVNSIYQRLRRKGVSDRNIYFVSIHMDHLHPRLRGSMIYYPHENLRPKHFYARGRIYRKYRESKNIKLKFASYENRRASSYSYAFSKELVRRFKAHNIPVHSYRPIRPFVYRRNRKWVPAVIKYSKVPTSVLIEVVNMANRSDRANIQNHGFRQRVAEAIARAIL